LLEESARSRRARPSFISFGLGWIFLGVAVYIASELSQGLYLALAFATAVIIGLAVCFYRVRGLSHKLPAPFGQGLITEVTLRRTTIQGALLVGTGVLLLFLPFVALYFLPGGYVILAVLALMAGLAASELFAFLWISALERRTKGRIVLITELSEKEGKQVLLKSAEIEHPESEETEMWPTGKVLET